MIATEIENVSISSREKIKEIYQVLPTAAKAWIVRSHIRLDCAVTARKRGSELVLLARASTSNNRRSVVKI